MRIFTNSLIAPYAGALGAQAITAHQKSSGPPQGISLTVPWYQYALAMNIAGGTTVFNAGVGIDLTRAQVAAPVDIVKSVFIDNTAVDRPVYLRCEDTGQVITCADSSFGWFPVITNGEQFTLFTDNIIPLRDGRQVTRLIFSNASFDTFGGSEYNRAQALYRASGTSNFVAPTLGDKITNATTFTTTFNNNQIIFPATPNSQVVITSVTLVATNTAAAGNTAFTRVRIMRGATSIISIDPTVPGQTIATYTLPNLQVAVDGSVNLTLNASMNASFGTTYDNNHMLTMTYAQITLPALS